MKLSFASLFAVVLGTALLSAQAPPGGEKVTVAGCLQRAERNGSAGGTVVGTSASPNTAGVEANSGALVDAFLLSEATPVVAGVPQAPAAGATANAPGTTATGTSGKTDITTFGLSGREAELERHQGARLQVAQRVRLRRVAYRATIPGSSGATSCLADVPFACC